MNSPLQRTALLVIDAQREYFDEDGALFTPHAAGIIKNLQTFLGSRSQRGVLQVIFIRHVNAQDGSDLGRMGDFDDEPSFVAGTKGVQIVPNLARPRTSPSSTRRATARLPVRGCRRSCTHPASTR